MKKNVIIAILATFVITFGGLAVIGLSMDNNYNGNLQITTSENYGLDNELLELDMLTVEEYSAYMEGCMGEGASEQDCDCTVVYLEDNYGRSGIMDIGLEYARTSVVSPEMWDAIDYCTMRSQTL